MAIQWMVRLVNSKSQEIDDPNLKRVVFIERDDVSSERHHYVIVIQDNDTKATVLAKLKSMVLASRAQRTALAVMTENFDSNALEAYINA